MSVSTTFRSTVYFKVTYRCPHCDQHNTDTGQFKVITGTASSSDAQVSELISKEDYNKNTKKLFDDLKNRKYSRLDLHCVCAECHKKPLWASYLPADLALPPFALALMFFGAAFLLSVFRGFLFPNWAFIIACVSLVPYIVFSVINAAIDRKTKKLDEKYHPFIELISERESTAFDRKKGKKAAVKQSPRSESSTPPPELQDREPNANEWKCPACGRINQNYVGSCGCGASPQHTD